MAMWFQKSYTVHVAGGIQLDDLLHWIGGLVDRQLVPSKFGEYDLWTNTQMRQARRPYLLVEGPLSNARSRYYSSHAVYFLRRIKCIALPSLYCRSLQATLQSQI